ncbi:programmed cell death 6-interacting protein-like [Rhopilema esculentum]|uniref:programmed cell death 6-interacting protein-like n=1 Tax=Rhopilema esculentum TaxID=499914 RepID=UPI0031E28938
MSSLLQIPLKKSQNVELIKPFSNYIKNTFSEEKLRDTKDALAELSQLRANAVVKSLDKHETSLEVLQRYYDQLCSMEAKLPITEDQIRISFTWQDAFDKGGIFGATKASLINGAYEKCCVLFNIGSLFSQIACSQNLGTDDGMKTAAKYFQQASGIFSHLKEVAYPQLNTLPTPDFAVDCLATLSAIMLAQAQDCYYQKASEGKMKVANLAKIAAQTADFYQDANRLATSPMVKSMWEKEWIPILSGKQAYFTAVAEYHQASVCEEQKKFGEAVARLQKAEKYILDGIRNGDKYYDCREMADSIKKKHAGAKKDNDIIYLDKIPRHDSLDSIGKAALAKATSVQSPLSSSFTDLFPSLVPVAVNQAVATFESKKADLVNKEIGRLRESTQVLNGILASLNLPAAIEDLSGAKVPQSVLDKSTAVKQKGGLNKIDQMMQDLPDLLNRNKEIIDETIRMMDEEEQEDTQMKDRFQSRWNRTPSKLLTEQLRAEGAKYMSILNNATKADAIVKTKYNENRRAMDILCKSAQEIEAALPKGGSNVAGGGQSAVQELRKLMADVDEMKKEREKLEEQFKETPLDMAPKFLQALSAEGFIDSERISNVGLEEKYGEYQREVDESLNQQEALLAKIQDANNRFVAEKQSSGAASQRDQMLKELAQAYDAFIELLGNLQEGSKFYNDLTEIVLKFQSKVSDLVFARRTEKDDLSKDIQNQIAKSAPERAPAVPSHIQAQERSVPDRPPPPRSSAPSQPPAQQPAQQPAHQQFQQPPQYWTGPNAPNAPYPTQSYMPQAGMYAPPGGMAGYAPAYQHAPHPQYQAPPYGQPYGYQQPPVGYSGYPYQQPPQQH